MHLLNSPRSSYSAPMLGACLLSRLQHCVIKQTEARFFLPLMTAWHYVDVIPPPCPMQLPPMHLCPPLCKTNHSQASPSTAPYQPSLCQGLPGTLRSDMTVSSRCMEPSWSGRGRCSIGPYSVVIILCTCCPRARSLPRHMSPTSSALKPYT